MTPYVVALAGMVIVLATLIDAFEVVLLPRPVHRRVRLNRYFFDCTWAAWAWLARRWPAGHQRENFLGVYGPLAMVSIFMLWAVSLVTGFGLLQWATHSILGDGPARSLASELIVSGDAFFTLGYGDAVPRSTLARMLIIVEAGTGFGFIALTVGYLPVLYNHFSRRDRQLIEFSVRAGTPPSAAALLRWHRRGNPEQLVQWLRDWEDWASDVIESHAVYPVLAFYRSQHEGQSWLASLSVVLDVCTIVVAGSDDTRRRQAAATFSAARRVAREMCESLGVRAAPRPFAGRAEPDSTMTAILVHTLSGEPLDSKTLDSIARLRQSYEPQLESLSAYLMIPLPAWGVDTSAIADGEPGRDEVVEQLLRDKSV